METERIAKLEAKVESIQDDVKEVKEDIKEIHSRITTGNRELADKIDNLDRCMEARMAKSAEVSKQQHDEIRTSLQGDIKTVTERVDVLERWRWMIVGGAIVLGYIVGNLDLFTKVFK